MTKPQFHNSFRNSAEAIASILHLHFPTGTIIDVNYGIGAFYRNTDRVVTGVDIRPPASILADNRALPFRADSFEVGVLDPPFKSKFRQMAVPACRKAGGRQWKKYPNKT